MTNTLAQHYRMLYYWDSILHADRSREKEDPRLVPRAYRKASAYLTEQAIAPPVLLPQTTSLVDQFERTLVLYTLARTTVITDLRARLGLSQYVECYQAGLSLHITSQLPGEPQKEATQLRKMMPYLKVCRSTYTEINRFNVRVREQNSLNHIDSMPQFNTDDPEKHRKWEADIAKMRRPIREPRPKRYTLPSADPFGSTIGIWF